jgi:centromere protein I
LDPEIIGKLYSLLFNFLEYEYLGPHIAQLLFLATKRHHVTDTRINKLFNLCSKNYRSDHIAALALLYREYNPGEVLDMFPKMTAKVFRHPNQEYLEELMALRNEHATKNAELRYLEQLKDKLKQRRSGRNMMVNYASSFDVMHRQNVSDIDDFVRKLDSLSIPRDWNTVLSDRSGFSILTLLLKGTVYDEQGLNSWIHITLSDFDSLTLIQRRTFLENTKIYVEHTNEVPTSLIEDFLMSEDIFMKHSEMVPFAWFFLSNITSKNLDELEVLVILYNGLSEAQDASWISGYLDAMSILLQRAYDHTVEINRFSVILQSILRILLKLLRKFNYSRSLGLSVISFIKFLQRIQKTEILPVRDIVLPPQLIYALLFMDDPIIFSEVCGHLNFCKSILKDTEPSDEVIALTNIHNSYVVDICNLVWRNKAFDIGKNSRSAFGLSQSFTNAFATTVPIFDKNSSFKSLFNLHHAPAFASLSANILRRLEDADPECETRHEGPLTASSVQDLIDDVDSKWLKMGFEDIRVEILKELENQGYVGLSKLLFSHLKSLLNKR